MRTSTSRSRRSVEGIASRDRLALALLYAVAAPVIALIVTFIITSIVILISGANPLDAFSNMIDYSTRGRGITSIINQATPLFIAGVAVAIGFQMNLFNIGVEGQYRLAGLIAAWAGAEVALPAPLHVGFIILVAMVVGSLWAGIAGVLKVTRNVNEVISTIMLNQIAFGVILGCSTTTCGSRAARP